MTETDHSAARQRRVAFAVSWIAYASYYLCRKGVSVTKARLVHDLSLTEPTLAAIDTGFLVAYAFGQFASGLGVQRVGGRRMIAVGMIGSALCCAVFGASSLPLVLVIVFALNGLFQATGWPAAAHVMSAWYPPGTRGTAMGLWSTCYQVGGLLATGIATTLLARHGWRTAFIAPAVWVAFWGIVVSLTLREAPATGGGLAARSDVRAVLADPRVWTVGFAHACLKVILYGLIFWLPYYLHTAVGYDEATAGYLSITLEIGGIFGTIVSGVLSDRPRGPGGLRPRPVVAAVMMILLGIALYAYSRLVMTDGPPPGLFRQGLCLAGIGFLLFGPESLVAGAAAQDLGGARGTSVAVGVVNGLGSVGAIVQGWFTLGLRHAYGWRGVFAGFLVVALVGAAALLWSWKASSRALAV